MGWDSADWHLLTPLMKAGRLPTLAKLVAGGAWGNLASLEPMLSPLLWTSMTTGKFPHEHGVLGFIEPDPQTDGVRPVGSKTRQVKALWNMLSESGLKAHVVAWYASHPAEKISGVCLSERFPQPLGVGPSGLVMEPGVIEPVEKAATFASLRVHPREIEGEQLQFFIPKAHELNQRDPKVRERLTTLASILAEAGSVQAAATAILETEEWDFLGVYFRALDSLGHHFMAFHPPAVADMNEPDARFYSEVMARACEFHDAMLARLLALAGKDVTVMLVSDHGFQCGKGRPGLVADHPDTMAEWHRQFGIVVMAGPELVVGEKIFGSVVLDVAPTVLQLFGLPVGKDMGGKVLATAWKTPPAIVRIPTWETEKPSGDSHIENDAAYSQKTLEQLVALGYLDPSALAGVEPMKQLAKQAAFEIEMNRIGSYIQANDFVQATRLGQRLVRDYSLDRRPYIRLAQAMSHQGRIAEARALLEEMIARLGSCRRSERILAYLCNLQGDTNEALARLQVAERADPTSSSIQEQMGDLYIRRRAWRQAEIHYGRAVNLDAENAFAWRGLAQALVRQNRDREAAGAALTAVELLHHFPAGHVQLGAILSKMRFYDQAIKAFETALVIQPSNSQARRYIKRLRSPTRVKDTKKLDSGLKPCTPDVRTKGLSHA